MNDNAPVFSKSTISVTIDESKAVGSVVTTFTATDKDKGKNGDIVYSLVNGNKHERFAIDSKSGKITVRSKIDRDAPNNEHFFDISVGNIIKMICNSIYLISFYCVSCLRFT